MQNPTFAEVRKQYDKALPLSIEPFYNSDYNETRRLKAMIFSHILSNDNDFDQMSYDDQIEIIMRIENSCANETIRKARGYNLRCVWDNVQFINIYHTVCYNIISILCEESNTLVKRILNKEINLNIIANMTCKELMPEKYDNITSEINKRVNVTNTVKYTEMYFCKKCKRNQTTVERIQNRSNDESSSFNVTCSFCGNKWFV